MKAISEMLKKLPFKKKNDAEEPSAPKHEPISFKGFWKDNFSREAVSGKWQAYRDSFKGDSSEAETNRKNIRIKAAFISSAALLVLGTSLTSEMLSYGNTELCGNINDLFSIKEVVLGWTEDVDKLKKLMVEEELEEELKIIYDSNSDVEIKVPFYSQKDYPTGCELVSTSMLLAKYGIKLKADEIVKKGYIKTKEVYLDQHEDPYGPDPNMTFIGDPLEVSGYGCYSGAIVRALKKILPSDQYRVVDLTGEDLDYICNEYIDRGIPVLYWGSLKMKPLFYDVVNHWYIDEGVRKGEEFHWLSNEHCMVLTGHTKESYVFNDPSTNKAGTKYYRLLVKRRFQELGNQAVAIVPINKSTVYKTSNMTKPDFIK